MASLSLPNNDYTANTLILSSEVVADFTAIVNKINGNLHYDNLGVMTGAIVWSLSSNVSAVSVTTNSNITAVDVNHTTNALAAGKHLVHVRSSATHTVADTALVKVEQNGASSTEPPLQIENSGIGATAEFNSTTRGILLPRVTTAQRQTMTTYAVAGEKIYNTDLKREECFDGTYWRAPNSGALEWLPEAAGSLRTDVVYCDGSTLTNNHTNAFLIALISSTWGGARVLPDLRRKGVAGDGGSVTAGPSNTVGSSGGAETMLAHTHSFSATTGAGSAHTHSVTETGHVHALGADMTVQQDGGGGGGSNWGFDLNNDGNGTLISVDTGGGDVIVGGTTSSTAAILSAANESAHTHSVSGTSGSTGTGSAQGNWAPTAIMKPYLVL